MKQNDAKKIQQIPSRMKQVPHLAARVFMKLIINIVMPEVLQNKIMKSLN